jgi:hypothetical protein
MLLVAGVLLGGVVIRWVMRMAKERTIYLFRRGVYSSIVIYTLITLVFKG